MHVHDPRNVGAVHALPGQTVHLLAGQLYFGHRATHIKTLLGSCVAVTLWHPERKLGGMCHFLLPNRKRQHGTPHDGRYGDEALAMLVEAIERAGTRPQDYESHLYGGADTMPDQVGIKFNIGERNIEQGWSLIDHYGFTLQAIDVGDHIPRTVLLNLKDGRVEMRRGQPNHQRRI
jgi:chemotaxis protein CheD